MKYTLADAKTAVAKFVEAGICPDDARVVTAINQAVRRLLERTDLWSHTIRRMRFCMDNTNTLTLPREAERVIGNPIIDKSPRRAFGFHYEFMDNGPGELDICDGYGKDLIDLGGGWPTFYDIPSSASHYLLALSTAASDTSKTLFIRGKGEDWGELFVGGDPGITLAINRWYGGTEGTLNISNSPLTVSTSKMREVTSVTKPITEGYICLYTYDASTHGMYFLGKYGPDETSPGYRRYRVTCPDFCNGNNVLVNVRLAYYPMIRDSDVLLVQNLDAIKLMIQSISAEDDSDLRKATELEARALMVLNNKLGQYTQEENVFQVSDPWGFGGRGNIY